MVNFINVVISTLGVFEKYSVNFLEFLSNLPDGKSIPFNWDYAVRQIIVLATMSRTFISF